MLGIADSAQRSRDTGELHTVEGLPSLRVLIQ